MSDHDLDHQPDSTTCVCGHGYFCEHHHGGLHGAECVADACGCTDAVPAA